MTTTKYIRAEAKPAAKERTKFWSFRAAGEGAGDLLLYGIIESESWWGDEITPVNFKNELDGLGDISVLNVFINSDGGDVFAGQAIHSMLKRHKAHVNVYIDGIAASIASVIAMAGDTVYMPRNSMMMIHSPWTIALGNARDFRKMADDLDAAQETLIAAYQDKSGMDRNELIAMLEAETWLSAERAVELGFADEIEQSKQIAAAVRNGALTINGQAMDLKQYRNAPELVAVVPPEPPLTLEVTEETEETAPPTPASKEDEELLRTPLALFERITQSHENRRF
ncbi:head maturation protease, ClpP-related [Paenibacillus sp. FSL R7-0331]|uniref:head maturation protease, ClpP-related n=1 Tax=Paenibacillus sp. FSL R7-0331 TaxID=1536773 RepID=UPI0005A72892|nr:head maturation protease, ClpP-related [Paenibacillus sp. FSL R7-0331]